MIVARELDRCCVSLGVSSGNSQTEAAVQILDLDNVGALHHVKSPETRWMIVAQVLHDLGVVRGSSSGNGQAKAAIRVHDRYSSARREFRRYDSLTSRFP